MSDICSPKNVDAYALQCIKAWSLSQTQHLSKCKCIATHSLLLNYTYHKYFLEHISHGMFWECSDVMVMVM